MGEGRLHVMAGQKLRILIVEDSQLTARVRRDMLNAQPDMTVVDVATTGQEAIRRAAGLCPDVILMDIHLPDIDGGHVSVALRRFDQSGEIPTEPITAESLTRRFFGVDGDTVVR